MTVAEILSKVRHPSRPVHIFVVNPLDKVAVKDEFYGSAKDAITGYGTLPVKWVDVWFGDLAIYIG